MKKVEHVSVLYDKIRVNKLESKGVSYSGWFVLGTKWGEPVQCNDSFVLAKEFLGILHNLVIS